MKDLLGRVISVGDPIAHVSVHGCCCKTPHGIQRVTHIEAESLKAMNFFKGYHPSDNQFRSMERHNVYRNNIIILRP